jgi:hypothetical protein
MITVGNVCEGKIYTTKPEIQRGKERRKKKKKKKEKGRGGACGKGDVRTASWGILKGICVFSAGVLVGV